MVEAEWASSVARSGRRRGKMLADGGGGAVWEDEAGAGEARIWKMEAADAAIGGGGAGLTAERGGAERSDEADIGKICGDSLFLREEIGKGDVRWR